MIFWVYLDGTPDPQVGHHLVWSAMTDAAVEHDSSGDERWPSQRIMFNIFLVTARLAKSA